MATSEQMLQSELLRLVTAGSVDDGKSTLIGRLLFATKQILSDQLEPIDVAYRSFVTPRRRFQLADAPGHVQYTRNMVTGASTADLGVILVDARKGVVEQTRRHSYILAMLELPHVVYVVNKMDLVGYAEERFLEIARELAELASRLGLNDVAVVPVSAPNGDNVSERTDAMGWYAGPTLLEHLETVELAGDRNLDARRFPVQWVIRPMADEHHDYRGYAGQVAGGVWRAGDEVVVLPSGRRTHVAAVESADGPLEDAVPGQSVTIRLADDVDVARGDMLADPERPPAVARELTARLCWMSDRPLEPSARLLVKQTTRTAPALAAELVSVVDIETLKDRPAPARMVLNDLGLVRLRLGEPLAVDPYAENRATGAFILVDEATNDTVGAGMVVEAHA